MARTIWNSAFRENAELSAGDIFTIGDYTAAFDEAVARLYEGMVLLPLGHNCRVQDVNYPGKAIPISIEVTSQSTQCLIDQNLPSEPSHPWRRADVPLEPGAYQFEFMNFFDWDQLGHRDFLLVEVLIRRMDARPEAIGHHALIPVADCLAWAPAENF